jgi:outer membrane protein TolC
MSRIMQPLYSWSKIDLAYHGARTLAIVILMIAMLSSPIARCQLTASLEPGTLPNPAAKASGALNAPAQLAPAQMSPVETTHSDASVAGQKTAKLELITYETPLEPVFEIDIPTLLHLVEGNSIDVEIAKNRLAQSKWGLLGSASKLLPSGSMYNYYERYRGADIFIGQNPFKTNRDTYQTKYMANYNIQLGGKDLFDIEASWHGMSRMKKMVQQSNQQAILDLLTQYNVYLRDISAIQVAKEALRQAEVQVRLSESRFHAGFTTKLDVSQARTLLAEKQGDLVKAQNQKLATEYGMASMLKLAIGVRLKPTDETLKPVQLVDNSIPIPKLFQLAVANRPDVKAMVDNIKEAKARYASTRAQLFPTVTVSGFKRQIGPQNQMQPSHEIFASISYDATRNMGIDVLSQMGQDKARIQEAILQKEKQLYDIQKDLSEAYLSSSLFYEQIKISDMKVQAAAESFKIARHRRMSGTGINLDVIQAEKDLANARQEYFSAVMNYNISQLKLLLQTGQLTSQRVLTALVF